MGSLLRAPLGGGSFLGVALLGSLLGSLMGSLVGYPLGGPPGVPRAIARATLASCADPPFMAWPTCARGVAKASGAMHERASERAVHERASGGIA